MDERLRLNEGKNADQTIDYETLWSPAATMTWLLVKPYHVSGQTQYLAEAFRCRARYCYGILSIRLSVARWYYAKTTEPIFIHSQRCMVVQELIF